jgi:hypothetical protein
LGRRSFSRSRSRQRKRRKSSSTVKEKYYEIEDQRFLGAGSFEDKLREELVIAQPVASKRPSRFW